MAEDIKIRISIPDNVYPFDEQYYSITRLISGEKKLFDFITSELSDLVSLSKELTCELTVSFTLLVC